MTLYDLSPEGIERFEVQNLLFTVDEMLAMDNKKRWAELVMLTYDENWTENDRKVNTARSLAFLIEFNNEQIETQFGVSPSFIEQYFIIKLIERGEKITKVARKTRRSIATIHTIMAHNNVTSNNAVLPKPVIVEKYDGEIIEFPSIRAAARSEYCTVTEVTLRRYFKKGSYANDIAKFYYKK